MTKRIEFIQDLRSLLLKFNIAEISDIKHEVANTYSEFLTVEYKDGTVNRICITLNTCDEIIESFIMQNGLNCKGKV